MIILKTEEEIEFLRECNQIVARTLGEMAKMLAPGISTLDLNKRAEEFIRDSGATPSFLGYNKFPASICTSVNEQVVHGIPSANVVLKEGDIISIDCGAFKNGFHGDSAYTFCIGDATAETINLLKTTKASLYKGIEQAVEGKRLGDIGFAVQTFCEAQGYSVVREMVGHGVGRKLREEPEVPNYGRRGSGAKLKSGMVLAIEPMINMGKKDMLIEEDGWTARTVDRKLSAHFEHSVVIRKGKADVLSSFEFIEEVLGEKEF